MGQTARGQVPKIGQFPLTIRTRMQRGENGVRPEYRGPEVKGHLEKKKKQLNSCQVGGTVWGDPKKRLGCEWQKA